MQKTKLITSFVLAGTLAIGATSFAHTTTSVITPESSVEAVTTTNVIDELRANGNYDLFLDQLESTGILEELNAGDSYTILALTDEVMNTIPNEISNDKNKLKAVLSQHVLLGNWTVEALQDELMQVGGKMPLETIDHQHIVAFYSDEGKVKLLSAKNKKIKLNQITATTNGVIYQVHQILEPFSI